MTIGIPTGAKASRSGPRCAGSSALRHCDHCHRAHI